MRRLVQQQTNANQLNRLSARLIRTNAIVHNNSPRHIVTVKIQNISVELVAVNIIKILIVQKRIFLTCFN